MNCPARLCRCMWCTSSQRKPLAASRSACAGNGAARTAGRRVSRAHLHRRRRLGLAEPAAAGQHARLRRASLMPVTAGPSAMTAPSLPPPTAAPPGARKLPPPAPAISMTSPSPTPATAGRWAGTPFSPRPTVARPGARSIAAPARRSSGSGLQRREPRLGRGSGQHCAKAVILATPLPAGPSGARRPCPSGPGYLNAVTFTDANHGWAVGSNTTTGDGVILATTDGGATWSTQSMPSGTGYLSAVTFTDASQGWAVGSNTRAAMHHLRHDQWRHHLESAVHALRTDDLNDVTFADVKRRLGGGLGRHAGNGMILATTNGGTTWSPADCCPPASAIFSASASSTLATAGSAGASRRRPRLRTERRWQHLEHRRWRLGLRAATLRPSPLPTPTRLGGRRQRDDPCHHRRWHALEHAVRGARTTPSAASVSPMSATAGRWDRTSTPPPASSWPRPMAAPPGTRRPRLPAPTSLNAVAFADASHGWAVDRLTRRPSSSAPPTAARPGRPQTVPSGKRLSQCRSLQRR